LGRGNLPVGQLGSESRGKFKYGKKIDYHEQWELKKRDNNHEKMVREFFESVRKRKRKNDRHKRNNGI
jgi:aconitase A